MALYKLRAERAIDPTRFVATWEFGGEMLIKELGTWVLMSYKCPARLSDIFLQNPTLLEREEIVGKSGAKYFGYRLRLHVTPNDIVDTKLKSFYDKITQNG